MQSSSTTPGGQNNEGPSENGRPGWKRWRKAERERLIDHRLSLRKERIRDWSQCIAEAILGEIATRTELVISAYWPIRGEPELRPLMKKLRAEGHKTALPVVVERGAAMIFRDWQSGDRLERGIWKIPVPADGAQVVPDVVIAPVVGFDSQRYRLGYGGGYFDRTLAGLSKHPTVIGVGYSCARIPSINPQPHDIPMSCIVTEEGVVT